MKSLDFPFREILAWNFINISPSVSAIETCGPTERCDHRVWVTVAVGQRTRNKIHFIDIRHIWVSIQITDYHSAELMTSKLLTQSRHFSATYSSDLYACSKNCEKRILISSCLSAVRPPGTTRLPLDGFSWKFVFEYFSKVCRKNWSFIKIW